MPNSKLEVEDIGVVAHYRIPAQEMSDSVFSIPPQYFKACHVSHIDVGKIEFYVIVLPESLHYHQVIVQARMLTIHDRNTPCAKPGVIKIAEWEYDEGYYELEFEFDSLLLNQNDPLAELDDFLEELEQENESLAENEEGNHPTEPEPEAEPEAESEPEPELTPGSAEEEARRREEELEKERERALRLGGGDEQMFINPRNDWMRDIRYHKSSSAVNGREIRTKSFNWYQPSGQEKPYSSIDYYDALKTPNGICLLRYSYAFDVRKSTALNDPMDAVTFRVVTVPVFLSGLQQLTSASQAALNAMWVKNFSLQNHNSPILKPVSLKDFTETDKVNIFSNPELAKQLPNHYRQAASDALYLASQLQKTETQLSIELRSLCFDIAIEMKRKTLKLLHRR